jgi:hypothetical protein
VTLLELRAGAPSPEPACALAAFNIRKIVNKMLVACLIASPFHVFAIGAPFLFAFDREALLLWSGVCQG